MGVIFNLKKYFAPQPNTPVMYTASTPPPPPPHPHRTPAPHSYPLLPSYVTHTKLSLIKFCTGFVLFIRLSAVDVMFIQSQLVNMSKIDGLSRLKQVLRETVDHVIVTSGTD